MGWANRIIALRDGRTVLDRRVAELDQAEVMDVYRRVTPDGVAVRTPDRAAPSNARTLA
jgi:ABC-type phosphate/phosphonate transport system ATPase subunit